MEPSSGTIFAYNPETLAYFRQKIELALQGLELRLGHNHDNEPKFLEELKGWESRCGERGTELINHVIINKHDEKQESDLQDALARLSNGTYGSCGWPGCGVTIPFARLDSIPQAKYCLDHEVEAQKKKKRY